MRCLWLIPASAPAILPVLHAASVSFVSAKSCAMSSRASSSVGDIRDPDVAGRPVTVTEVTVSPDLRQATVFVIPLGGGDATTLLEGLKRVAPYLRHEVARQVQLRVAPEFSFQADRSFDQAERIEKILNSPDVRRDLDADPVDGDEGDGTDGA